MSLARWRVTSDFWVKFTCPVTTLLRNDELSHMHTEIWSSEWRMNVYLLFSFEKVPYELTDLIVAWAFKFLFHTDKVFMLFYKVREKLHVLLPVTLAQKHRYLVIPSISRRLDKIIEIEFRMKISPTSYVKNAIQYSHLLTRQLLCLLQKSNLHYSTNSLLTFRSVLVSPKFSFIL